MMPAREPIVDRRRLRNMLRQTRESLGITQAAAAREMEWSVSKIIRIETGQVTISVNDLRALLGYYDITEVDRVKELVEMAKNSRRNSWLHDYRGIASDPFLEFLGHEDAAMRSYSFQPILIPGLLQTDDYATAVLQVLRGPKDPDWISRQVDLRLARQERIFAREDRIELNYLLDESVVRRVVGAPGAMKRQLDALIDSCQRDNLSIRIIPFDQGIYRSIRVPFVVLEFSNPADEAILFLEYPQGDSIVREDGPSGESNDRPPDPDNTALPLSPPTTAPTYLQIFSELRERTSDEETLGILHSARANLDRLRDSPGASTDPESPELTAT